MVSQIKYENRGTWPHYCTSIFFKDQINKCRNYKPDKQWGSVNVSWGHRTSGTTMAKVPWLGESLAATSTTCLAGLQHSLSRFFWGEIRSSTDWEQLSCNWIYQHQLHTTTTISTTWTQQCEWTLGVLHPIAFGNTLVHRSVVSAGHFCHLPWVNIPLLSRWFPYH